MLALSECLHGVEDAANSGTGGRAGGRGSCEPGFSLEGAFESSVKRLVAAFSKAKFENENVVEWRFANLACGTVWRVKEGAGGTWCRWGLGRLRNAAERADVEYRRVVERAEVAEPV